MYFQSGERFAESFRIVSNHRAVDPEDLPEPDFLDLHVIPEVNDSPRGASQRARPSRVGPRNPAHPNDRDLMSHEPRSHENEAAVPFAL